MEYVEGFTSHLIYMHVLHFVTPASSAIAVSTGLYDYVQQKNKNLEPLYHITPSATCAKVRLVESKTLNPKTCVTRLACYTVDLKINTILLFSYNGGSTALM